MTMKELAKLANVSVATVSKAFGEAQDISEETRQHVFAVAKQHGCYGKFYRGKYHKKVIAILCPELTSSYYTRFLEYLQELIGKAQCIPVIATDCFSPSNQAELVEYFACYLKVDGIIVFNLRSKLKKGYETPIVSLFSSEDRSVDSVSIDLETAVTDAVRLLSEHGHTQISFLGEKLTRIKAQLYERAMSAQGNSDVNVIESEYRFEEAGEDGVRQLLEAGREFTALICAYDNIAFGAIKALKRAGLRVPEDVSVVGIDNISASRYAETSLTSIDSNPEEVCRIAWDLLQKKMKSPYYTSKQSIVIGAELILRESVGKAPGKGNGT